jgi:hypothetical protein
VSDIKSVKPRGRIGIGRELHGGAGLGVEVGTADFAG